MDVQTENVRIASRTLSQVRCPRSSLRARRADLSVIILYSDKIIVLLECVFRFRQFAHPCAPWNLAVVPRRSPQQEFVVLLVAPRKWLREYICNVLLGFNEEWLYILLIYAYVVQPCSLHSLVATFSIDVHI